MKLQKMIAPTPPVTKPLINAPTAPRIEMTLKVKPRVRDQLAPRKKPIPVASHTRPKKSSPKPIINPRLFNKVPILGSIEASAGSPIITAPAAKPITPKSISKVARIMIPKGL